jgi:NADH dehydrogenase/NADH:ubiquinone oxidoreductase subunit G
MAWNDKASTAKRVTEPTIQGLLKMARGFVNGNKPEATPEEIHAKLVKAMYKNALEFKDNKKAQTRLSKVIAIAKDDNIELVTETENDSEE